MKLLQSILFGTRMMILLNVLMSFACLWLILRMAPAIEHIYDRNERSLSACETMLTSLLRNTMNGPEQQEKFEEALRTAERNITEKTEPENIKEIKKYYKTAFQNSPSTDNEAREHTVSAIAKLAETNRSAIVAAAVKARENGLAGAWGVVFMAVLLFTSGVLFKRFMLSRVVAPLDEIQSVFEERKNGNGMRRCTADNTVPRDFRKIFSAINSELDRNGNNSIDQN